MENKEKLAYFYTQCWKMKCLSKLHPTMTCFFLMSGLSWNLQIETQSVCNHIVPKPSLSNEWWKLFQIIFEWICSVPLCLIYLPGSPSSQNANTTQVDVAECQSWKATMKSHSFLFFKLVVKLRGEGAKSIYTPF